MGRSLPEAYFGTRLKKGLNSRTIKQLGKSDKLVEWTPQDNRRLWKSLSKSMRLRVIEYQIPGFRPSAIVTNVLHPRRLSRDAWVRMAANCDSDGKWKPGLDHRRWQIETSYSELKVVLGLKKLAASRPARRLARRSTRNQRAKPKR